MYKEAKQVDTEREKDDQLNIKQNDSDSDWNDNLYPQNYRAKSQSQVTPR